MKKFLGFALAVLWVSPAVAAPKLDIGADYRFRGIQLTNPSYTSERPYSDDKSVDQRYYTQRARVYLKGKFDPTIEIGTVLQAIGVSGSTYSLTNRYPREDFTPFIENMYVQANEFHGLPLNITLGRQPYSWGTGMLVSDDGLGFDAVRLDAGPFWGIRSHLLTAKATERFAGENDRDLHLAGLSYAWGIHNIRFGYIMENDRSGSGYTNLNSTNPVVSDKISRQFFDLQVNGRLERGAYYVAEYAMQKGKVALPTGDVNLSGSALTFEGGFDYIHPRYKRMILAFVFMQASGDDVQTREEDERFLPSFGRKYDGLERIGAGEFFAATPYSFFNENRAVVRVPVPNSTAATYDYTSLFSGLRTFGFKGSINPYEPFVAGLEFYLYTARELPDTSKGSPATINENSLGRELVIYGTYNYSKKINFAIRWGKFFPGENLNNLGSSRLIFEATGRF